MGNIANAVPDPHLAHLSSFRLGGLAGFALRVSGDFVCNLPSYLEAVLILNMLNSFRKLDSNN